MTTDARRYAPAAARNSQPILGVLREHLPRNGLVLEIASGSGEHAVLLAEAFGPDLIVQPTDPDPDARASIDAWTAARGLANVRPALALDARSPQWPLTAADAIVCINMIHIAPWAAAEGLMAGAGRILSPAGLLYLYGPFRRDGGHTAPSNAAFDADLRARDPAWGVRDLEAVTALAASQGLALAGVVAMPANNFSVLFRQRAA